MKNETNLLELYSGKLLEGINKLIENTRSKVSVVLNFENTLHYWSIGNCINTELKNEDRLKYDAKIVATLLQQLKWKYGRGNVTK